MRKKGSVFREESDKPFDAAIINAVLSVPGVAGVTRCTKSNLSVLSLSEDKSECGLELSLAVEYGSSIPAIHENIQRKLKEDVQTVTGLEVKKLSLYIEGIQHKTRECKQ
jgi:uncharacterized alkaline shock family protein YloU